MRFAGAKSPMSLNPGHGAIILQKEANTMADTMFHIAIGHEDLGNLCPELIEDYLKDLGADIAEALPEKDAEEKIKTLKERLRKSGFRILENDLPENCAFAFETGVQKNLDRSRFGWFDKDFRKLNNRLAALSVREYACDPFFPAGMSRLAEGGDGSLAWFSSGSYGTAYSFSAVIRRLAPETTYHVAKNALTVK